jgi:hypothetical protein
MKVSEKFVCEIWVGHYGVARPNRERQCTGIQILVLPARGATCTGQ